MRRLKGGSRTRRTSVDRSSRSACDRPPHGGGGNWSASSATAHTDEPRRSGGLRGPLSGAGVTSMTVSRARPHRPRPRPPAEGKKINLEPAPRYGRPDSCRNFHGK